jgi:hypothetical protein
MSIQSLRVTKKEIQNYYSPKTSDYEMMVNSINSSMGYGQIIQTYNGTEVTNTYYHVYNDSYGGPIVIDKTSGSPSSIADAGPTFWGVGSNVGINFLNGVGTISGLRKLKYCDGCENGNGLGKPVVENFSKRFRQLSELVSSFNLLEGFLFYDYTLPKYSNVFPSVKVDDGVNVTYKFKNVNNGADLTVSDVSQITGQPVLNIESSVDTAPIVKPQEGANTVITSCCDESIFYVISGQYTIGNILYAEDIFYYDGTQKLHCWFVESLTKDFPTISGVVFTSGGRSCAECVRLNPCPVNCESIELTYSTDPESACLGASTTYQIDWNTGILYNDGDCGNFSPAYGYYGDGKFVYYWDGSRFSDYGPCPSQDNYVIEWCCDGSLEVISSSGKPLTSGQYIYFDTYGARPVNCWRVKGNTTDPTTIEGKLTGATYVDCTDCQNQLGQFCKRRT